MSSANSSAGSERRQFGRRRSQLHAVIQVPGRPALPCVVHNISDGGALLVCERPTWLPFYFQLVIESEGIEVQCELRHQTGNATGVYFVKKQQI